MRLGYFAEKNEFTASERENAMMVVLLFLCHFSLPERMAATTMPVDTRLEELRDDSQTLRIAVTARFDTI